jgi:hypothetical protein
VAARGGCAARRLHGETAARRDGRASMKAAAAAAFGGGLSPNSHGETAARRLRGSSARRGVDNLDRDPAVTLPCTGIRLVQHSRLLRIPFEISKESSGGPVGIIRWSSFARHRDRRDCGGCRTDHRGVGSVEVFEETFRALRNCRSRGAGQTDLSLPIRSANRPRLRLRGDCKAFQECFAKELAYFHWIHL